MLQMDQQFLTDVGLGELPPEATTKALRHFYSALELRVGWRLAAELSDTQLAEFEGFFDAKDEAGAFEWLSRNVPGYEEIVTVEFARLKQEIAANAAKLLAIDWSNSEDVVRLAA